MKKKYISPRTNSAVIDEKEYICQMISSSPADDDVVLAPIREDDDFEYDDEDLW